jgi:hypothetical protein
MQHVLVNTWLMSINPGNIARFEWDDCRDTIYAHFNDSDIADRLYENVDWEKTDVCKAYSIVTKQVFDWMHDTLKLFDGIEQDISGFAVEYGGYYRHGLTGLNVEINVNYENHADVVKAIKALPKDKFDAYMVENHSSGSGFHSFIPNHRDGLLAQDEMAYMMGCYLGYLIHEKTATMEFENDFNDAELKFESWGSCPAVLDFDTTTEAYELIVFEEGTEIPE